MEGRNWCKSFPLRLLQQLFWETGYRILGYGALNLHLVVLNLECILKSSLGLFFPSLSPASILTPAPRVALPDKVGVYEPSDSALGELRQTP